MSSGGLIGRVIKNRSDMKHYSKLVLSLVPEYCGCDEREIHSYWGAFYHQNRDFVMKFDRDDGSVEFTGDEDDAFLFTDDEMCTECMEILRDKYHAFTIAQWIYKGSPEIQVGNKLRGRSEELTKLLYIKAYEELKNRTPTVQFLIYPNESYTDNGYLMPSLMNRTLDEWREQNDIKKL